MILPVILVAAAASARPALEAAKPAMERAAGEEVVVRYGATGSFARQIENGAPFDLFFAADEETPKSLAEKGLLIPETLRLYLEGTLALVKSRESAVGLPDRIDAAFLARLPSLSFQRLALASPKVAPYGRAAEEALRKANVLRALGPRLVAAGNVEEALQYVASGNAELGFAALSLSKASGLAFAPVDASLHSPIRQFAGVVSASKKRVESLRALDAVTSGSAKTNRDRSGAEIWPAADGSWIDPKKGVTSP